ncbi:MAG: hypothetical protein CL472_04480 [Acidobacteria bacterium]|nr:hypothetical protein [Acidobacteriota bacterium]
MDIITNNIWMILILLALVIGVLFVSAKMSGRQISPYAPKRLMTDHEKVFFPKLEKAASRLGGYRVFPQVAMSAIIDTHRDLAQSARLATRNTFDRKIIDFVIVDENMHVVMIVELDDRTHRSDKDARRDSITAGAGYATVRLRNGRKITIDQIERELRRVWKSKVNV